MTDSTALATGQPQRVASLLANMWTNSVAYLALLASAGLSMAGNVADVIRTRGQAMDGLDVAIAVAMPGLVVLAVHMFVSPRWDGLAWPMQTLRWAGCLAIGAMAMFVSWFHLHDLLVARTQPGAATILEPLALDAMAVMATALLLAGRRTVGQASTLANDLAATELLNADLANAVAILSGQVEEVANQVALLEVAKDISTDRDNRGHFSSDGRWPEGLVPDLGHRPRRRGQEVVDEAEAILRVANLPGAEDLANRGHRLGDNVASDAEAIRSELDSVANWMDGQPENNVPIEVPNPPGLAGVAQLVAKLTEIGATPAEMNAAIAETYHVSLRTARRWRGQVGGQ